MIEYGPNWESTFLWAAIVGFILAFLVAFGMGANDCANSYGTVVGSGVLKLWQAYILATFFEALGASLLGYKVTDTMRKSIVDVSIYDVYSVLDGNRTSYVEVDSNQCANTTNCSRYTSADFIVGEVGALTGTAFWLMLATVVQFPVSTTHSAVGATVGFSLVLKGANGINWATIGSIVVSWVASPALAGLISVCFYLVIKFTCLKRTDQFESSLKMLPFFYWFTLVVNIFSVLYGGSKYLKLDELPWWACLLISLAIGTSVAVFMWLWGVDLIRQRVLKKVEGKRKDGPAGSNKTKELNVVELTSVTVLDVDRVSKFSNGDSPTRNRGSGIGVTPAHTAFSSTAAVALGDPSVQNGSVAPTLARTRPSSAMVDALKAKLKTLKRPVEEHPLATAVFTYLQIMSACFLSFSHGSNDTANAVGPLVGLWVTYRTGYALNDDSNLEYIILFGVGSMIIGLWLLGHKVIKMIGTKIVEVTPASGFSMELGTAFTVLMASKIGIPISTTHCAVGAIVAVGWVKSHKGGVSWTTFRNIGIAWVVTLPVAGAVSALVAFLLDRYLVNA